MKASEALIAWTPSAELEEVTYGMIKIGPVIKTGEPDWTEGYVCTGGAAYADRREMQGQEQLLAVLIDIAGLIIRDGLIPEVVHEAFLEIDEYRDIYESRIR